MFGMADALGHGRTLLSEVQDLVVQYKIAVPVSTELVREWPHELVGEHTVADVLVVGGPHLGQEEGIGPVTSSALHHAPCPLVLVTRDR